MTLSDLRSLVCMFCGDSSTSPAYLELEDIDAYGNEAARAAAAMTKMLEEFTTVTLDETTITAEIPDDVLDIVHCWYDDDLLFAEHPANLAKHDAEYQQTVGYPGYYYTDGLNRLITVYPKPQAPTDIESIPETPSTLEGQVSGTPGATIPHWPTELTGDGEVV